MNAVDLMYRLQKVYVLLTGKNYTDAESTDLRPRATKMSKDLTKKYSNELEPVYSYIYYPHPHLGLFFVN